MSRQIETTTETTIAVRLRELPTLFARLTQVVNSVPAAFEQPPVSPDEIATIRQAENAEQRERAASRVRAAARRRLRYRLEESVRVQSALNDAAVRVQEILALVRYVRGRAVAFARDNGSETLHEIERLIAGPAETDKSKKAKPLKNLAQVEAA